MNDKAVEKTGAVFNFSIRSEYSFMLVSDCCLDFFKWPPFEIQGPRNGCPWTPKKQLFFWSNLEYITICVHENKELNAQIRFILNMNGFESLQPKNNLNAIHFYASSSNFDKRLLSLLARQAQRAKITSEPYIVNTGRQSWNQLTLQCELLFRPESSIKEGCQHGRDFWCVCVCVCVCVWPELR